MAAGDSVYGRSEPCFHLVSGVVDHCIRRVVALVRFQEGGQLTGSRITGAQEMPVNASVLLAYSWGNRPMVWALLAEVGRDVEVVHHVNGD